MNNTKIDIANRSIDSFKWLLVIFLLGGGLFGFYYFAEHSLLVRVISLLAIASLAIWIALATEKGRQTKEFLREAHLEVRRVVWPTRQETVQMTGIVLVMVLIVSLIIWVVDSILMWMVRYFTGQGG
jgi:preprotein translocase subunit SecE